MVGDIGGQGYLIRDYVRELPKAPVRVTSLGDFVELAPVVLGFHPQDSLVVMAIDGTSLAVCARTDLAPGEAAPMLQAIRPVWQRYPAASLVAIAFTHSASWAWWALDELLAAVPRDMAVLALHADGERYYDLPGEEGVPYDAFANEHLVRATLDGVNVRGSREELEALIRPNRTPEEVTDSIVRVGETLSGPDLAPRALALVHAHDEVPGPLDLDDATLLVYAMHMLPVVDEVVLTTTPENADARLSLWQQVVQATAPGLAGAPLLALGLAGWISGCGVWLSLCLEATDGVPVPESWLCFLEGVVAEAVEPERWPALREAFLADRVAHGGSDPLGAV